MLRRIVLGLALVLVSLTSTKSEAEPQPNAVCGTGLNKFACLQEHDRPINMGASDPDGQDSRSGNVILSTQFGISVRNSDNTNRINDWLNYCNTNRVPCKLVGASSGVYFACGIIIPGPYTTLIGNGQSGTKLTAKAACDRDFITAPVVAAKEASGQRMPVIREINIDCANYSNSIGNCISLPPDEINSYGTGIQIVDAYIDRPAETGVYVGKNRGSGYLQNVFIYHYKKSGLKLDGASDWNCLASNFSGNYAIGSFADAGVHITGGANSTFIQCRSYQNRYGIKSEYKSISTPFTWISGDLSANSRNGAFIDSGGFPQSPVISGTRFAGNSLEDSNRYSDIVVSRNSGAILANNIFVKSGSSVSKFLIETVQPVGPVVALGSYYDTTNAAYQPFGTAVTNDFANVPIPHADVLSAVTVDDTTLTRLTASKTSAGSAGIYKITDSNKKIIMKDLTIIASDPASDDIAEWDVDMIIMTKSEAKYPVSIAAYKPIITAKVRTGLLSTLSVPTISVDTTDGSLSVTTVGLKGKALQWTLTSRTIEQR